MTQLHRHFRWAPHLVPATFASLVSLFAIAPAETMLTRILHAPHPITAPSATDAPPPEIVLTTHFGPHENPAMRLQRYAYKPQPPQDAHEQPACADGACFDPDGFEPASGGVSSSAGGPSFGPVDASEVELPSSPSQDAQFDIAGLGDFANGGDSNGGGGGGGGSGGGNANDNGGGGSGRPGGASVVLLPGAGGSGGESGASGTGGGSPQPSSSGEPGNGGTGGVGFIPGGGFDETGEEEAPVIETTSLRAAPAAGPAEVSAPGTALLLAAALAVLGLRRRSM